MVMVYSQRARSCACCVLALILCAGCSNYRPADIDNVCAIFHGETSWYEDARDASKRWGTPIWVMMAILHQESSFKDDARPERDWFLFIPLPRNSSAYGYAQAQDATWDEYIKATDNGGDDRDDFTDAVNFVGWYTHGTQRKLGISKWDAYHQYLAYHEGRGGYKKGSWKNKSWLKKVASRVKVKAATYNKQLKSCQAELDDEVDSWFF